MDMSVSLLYPLRGGGLSDLSGMLNDVLKGRKTELKSPILCRHPFSFGPLAEMSEPQVCSWRCLLAVVYESFMC